MTGNGQYYTKRRLFLFFLSVIAFVVVRNMFYMLVSNSVLLYDDLNPKDTAAAGFSVASSRSREVETMLRIWSPNTSTVVVQKNLILRELVNDSVLLVQEKNSKNNKNHTLLKANMSHVGEIVKKLKDSPIINLTANFASPHAFKYVIKSPNICGKDRVFILVYIHTAPDHYKRRTVIRQTWGNMGQYDVPMRLVFVMGVATISADLNNTKEQKALYFESEQYGDLVQEDFLDSYHNLTHKGVAALKWISNYCRQAVFILKTDDDIFVNTYTLIRHMLHLEKDPNNTRALLMCAVWYGMPVMRTGKWKVRIRWTVKL